MSSAAGSVAPLDIFVCVQRAVGFAFWLNSDLPGTVTAVVNCLLSRDHRTLCGFGAALVHLRGGQATSSPCLLLLHDVASERFLHPAPLLSSVTNLKIPGPPSRCLVFFHSSPSPRLQQLFNPPRLPLQQPVAST